LTKTDVAVAIVGKNSASFRNQKIRQGGRGKTRLGKSLLSGWPGSQSGPLALLHVHQPAVDPVDPNSHLKKGKKPEQSKQETGNEGKEREGDAQRAVGNKGKEKTGLYPMRSDWVRGEGKVMGEKGKGWPGDREPGSCEKDRNAKQLGALQDRILH